MIVAENISKYYGAHAAVADVSFAIARNEVVGLLGLNGAGKTTTLRILSGLLVPTSGTVRVGEVDMAREPERARAQVGFLPEVPPLYPDMTVEGFLRFVARLNGVRGNLDAAVATALEATDIVGVRKARIGTLSHGYQRRVGIAHVVVQSPALILLDEPTSGLDPKQIVQMRSLIRSLKQRHTIMVSSHILSEMHELCDRILVMHEGRIVAEGSERELAGRVSGATAIDVEVRASRDALAAALGRLATVRRHEVLRESDGLLEATVHLETDGREELARALVEAGVGLRRIDRSDGDLESIFLQLTERRAALRQEEVAGA